MSQAHDNFEAEFEQNFDKHNMKLNILHMTFATLPLVLHPYSPPAV